MTPMSDLKIAILFRGPLRPTPAKTRICIQDFKRIFSGFSTPPKTYLATWNSDTIAEQIAELGNDLVDNIVCLQMPNQEIYGNEIENMRLPSGWRARNCFYQYYMSKIAIDMICNHRPYDYIIHSRTDFYIHFGPHLEKWLDSETRDEYKTIHVRNEHPGSFVNDQIAVASPEVMRRAWDYQSIEHLKALIHSAPKPEEILQVMLDNAGISPINVPYVASQLDAERHSISGF